MSTTKPRVTTISIRPETDSKISALIAHVWGRPYRRRLSELVDGLVDDAHQRLKAGEPVFSDKTLAKLQQGQTPSDSGRKRDR